jgi:hypothetical protein
MSYEVADVATTSASASADLNGAAIAGRSNGDAGVAGGVISNGNVNPLLSLSEGAADLISIRL